MPLTKPAVTALDLERSITDLWHEFLSGYFSDGAFHAIGPHQSVIFPKAELRFQQSPVSQPLDGRAITLTMASPARTTRRWETVKVGATPMTQEMFNSQYTFSFWIRASGRLQTSDDVSDNPAAECRRTADKLHALISNAAATKPLGEKGIQHLRPRPPQLVSSSDTNGHDVRLITCTGIVKYPVLSQP